MGNDVDSYLGKYSCSCIQKEDGCFMDFFANETSKDPFNFITNSSNKKNERHTMGGNRRRYEKPKNIRSTEKKENNNR